MIATEKQQIVQCSQCGISEAYHRELYGTPLGVMTFAFQPDRGEKIQGRIRLCRPCTHEVLSRRILNAAGVPDDALPVETWQ